ncbi:MAG TPA: GGDEF domain-containing protein, partial [Polyangia bacterium]
MELQPRRADLGPTGSRKQEGRCCRRRKSDEWPCRYSCARRQSGRRIHWVAANAPAAAATNRACHGLAAQTAAPPIQLFLDLDKFKPINDTLGHAAGDWLLKSVARRLTNCLRDYDTAARFGGDEFVVLLSDLAGPEDALRVAERILAALAEPFITDNGERLEISASIGMALYPDHAEA